MKRLIWVMVLWVGLHFMIPAWRAATRPSPRPDVDLAKIQKEEEERRKKAPKPKHSFTDEDLKKAASSKEKTNITEVTAKKDESAKKKAENQENTAKKETPGEAVTAENQGTQGIGGPSTLKAALKTENYWKEEQNRIQSEIKTLETLVKEEEDKLGQLKNRYHVQGIEVLTEQLLVEKEMNKSAAIIDDYKASLEALKKELEDLYEKARKEGIPPGWLRD